MVAEANDRDSRLDDVIAAYLQAVESGTAPERATLLERHPDLADDLRAFFNDFDQIDQATAPLRASNPAAPVPADLRHFGDYELLEEIGCGGMGIVYKARQISLNRIVALKRIRAGQLASPEEVARFLREAKAAAGLDHPHIVPIYEIGEQQGQHYFTMKLFEGGNLATFSRDPKGSADQRTTATLMVKIAQAVHHAHQRGILHRDLKPSNILLDSDGQPHVGDFGLAQPLEREGKLTQSGAIVGTPEYMAPEQARGEKGLTTAADVYGLGAILYFLLAGRPPFQGDYNWETLKQVVEEEPVRPGSLRRKVKKDLETVCLMCLSKAPAKRYGSAAALADDLENWLQGRPIEARRAGRLERAYRWTRRKPALAALMLVTLLAVPTVLGGGLHFNWELKQKINAVSILEDDLKASQRELILGKVIFAKKNAQIQDEIQQVKAQTPALRKVGANQKTEIAAQRTEINSQTEQTKHLRFTAQLSRVSAAISAKDYYQANLLLYDESKCPVHLRSAAWSFYANLCANPTVTLARPAGTNEYATVTSFLGDSRTLVTVAPKGFEFWNTTTGTLASTAKADVQMGAPTFSPDGRFCALRAGKTMRLLNVITGQMVASFTDVEGMAFTSDGKTVAVLAEVANPKQVKPAKSIMLVDVGSGKVKVCAVPGNSSAMTFTPDARFIYVSPSTVLDTTTGACQPFVDDQPTTRIGECKSVAFSNDGKYLARLLSWGENRYSIEVLDWPTKKVLSALRDLVDWVGEFFLAGDANEFLVLMNGSKQGIWNVKTNTLHFQPNGSFLAISPDRKKILTKSFDEVTRKTGPDVLVWDVRTGELEARFGPIGNFEFDRSFERAVFRGDAKMAALTFVGGKTVVLNFVAEDRPGPNQVMAQAVAAQGVVLANATAPMVPQAVLSLGIAGADMTTARRKDYATVLGGSARDLSHISFSRPQVGRLPMRSSLRLAAALPSSEAVIRSPGPFLSFPCLAALVW